MVGRLRKSYDRRRFLALAGLSVAAPSVLKAGDTSIVVRDMAGRTIPMRRRPRRIVLLEARDVVTMALLHHEPAELVAGWGAVDRIDSDVLRQRHEPAGRPPIAVIARQSPDTISLEGIVSLNPDLVVATSYMEPGGPGNLVARLQEFGIPVVYSDVATNGEGAVPHRSPQDALPDLMRMWGAILGREEEAERFVAFHRRCFERIAQRIAGAPPCKTYLEIMSVSDECCWAAGQRVWGELLSAAGGRSLDGVSAPWFSRVQIEHLIDDKPDVYIATGGAFSSRSRPALGPGLDSRLARENLKRLTGRAGFSFLPAVRNGRVHAVWTGLITVQPFNLLFAEIVAKWLHPELTSDIDPDATLAELNERFSTKLDGALWISLV